MTKYIPNYQISIFSVETNSGTEWIAKYPDVVGCVGGGSTAEEALLEAKENLKVFLEVLDEENLPYPEISRQETYDASGKLLLRISKDLHSKLKRFASANETSVNQICVEAISEKIGTVSTSEIIERSIKLLLQPLTNMMSSKNNKLPLETQKIEGVKFNNTVIVEPIKPFGGYHHA